jgi:hypothetical protein
MPAVQAIGIADDRPPPFRLPMLNDRGDVAARLAAFDSMIIDDPDADPSTGGAANVSTARPPAPTAPTAPMTSRDGNESVATSSPSGTRGARADGDAHAIGQGEQPTESGEAPRGARVRAAATVPAHVRLLRADGVGGPTPVSYTADDWRGRIKGAPARADAHVYGAASDRSGGSAPAHLTARGSATVSGPPATVPGAYAPSEGPSAPKEGPSAPSGSAPHPAPADAATEARPASDSAVAMHGPTAGAARAKPVSILDRAARIGLLGGLLAIFILLFIFGPKISQWWSTR